MLDEIYIKCYNQVLCVALQQCAMLREQEKSRVKAGGSQEKIKENKDVRTFKICEH